MKNIIKITRFSSWWFYKIPLFIIVLLFTLVNNGGNVDINLMDIIKALFIIVLGATFVSILNDYTDREVDFISNKVNNFSKYNKFQSGLIMTFTLLVSLIIPWIFQLNFSASLCYYLAIISYFIYSVKPLRFKDKGIWGMVLDSLGSTVFPILCFLYCIYPNWSLHALNSSQIALLSWLFFLAMRSILLHQIEDKENDILSGTNTFVTHFPSWVVSRSGVIIFFSEIASLFWFIYTMKLYNYSVFVFFLIFYFGLQWLFKRVIYMKFSLFGKTNERTIIFMYDYYFSYLIISLVLILRISLIWKIGLLLVLIFLFPIYFMQQFNCTKGFFKALKLKVQMLS